MSKRSTLKIFLFILLCVTGLVISFIYKSTQVEHLLKNTDTRAVPNQGGFLGTLFKQSYTPVEETKKEDLSLLHPFDIVIGSTETNKTNLFECVPLRGIVSDTPICIYDPKTDVYVSASIKKYGAWEGNLISLVVNFLKLYQDMEFLDLGCNLGIYTISVTKFGRRVVAVDANVKNLRMLSKSLVLGGLQNHSVTLLRNAISDKVETVQITGGTKNVGGMHVVKAETGTNEEQKSQGVTMDHLTPLFDNKTLFIKMDIETNEWKALNQSTNFFSRVNVLYILMEWMHHSTKPEGKLIVKFLTEHSFQPYHPNGLKPLKVEEKTKWPGDILWIKQGARTAPST